MRVPSLPISAESNIQGDSAIRLSGVRLSFRGMVILDDVNMATVAGRISVLVGSNGAGKTSLIRLIAGLRKPDQGSIAVRPTASPRRAVFVFEEPNLYEHLSGHAHLSILGASDEGALSEACDALELDARLLDRKARGYSFGQRRKVTLAAAFATPGDLPMVFDEPTNGLDPTAVKGFMRLARRAADAGRDLLITGQDFQTLGTLADRVYLLKDGRVDLTADWRAHAEEACALEVLFKSAEDASTAARQGWAGGPALVTDRTVVYLGGPATLRSLAAGLMAGASAADIVSLELRPKDLGALVGGDEAVGR